MMDIYIWVSVLMFLGYKTSSLPAPQKVLKTFNLEELVPLQPDFYPERLTVEWFSDTEYIYREPGVGVRKHNIDTDTHTTLISEANLYNLSSHSISGFSKDGKYLLVASNRKKVYRYSSYADYSIYDLENRTASRLTEDPLQVVSWSPAGPALAFVQNNNVYYVGDVAAGHLQALQLTDVGEPGQVYCGVTDWIYEEEVFNTPEAFWFSFDGNYLAVAIFNDTNVDSASYPYYGDPSDVTNQYPQIISFKYPKAGRENPKVTLQVFDLRTPVIRSIGIPAPSNLGTDYILGRVDWVSDKHLLILWLNRRQNTGALVKCDMDASCHTVKQYKEPSGWIDVTKPLFDKQGQRMVDVEPMHEHGKRYMHATLTDFHTRSTIDLSPGNDTVTSVVGWNEETDTVYYIVAPEDVPSQRQLWAHSNGSSACVSCNFTLCHTASASFSPDGAYAVLTCSAFLHPPEFYMYFTQNKTSKLILDNKALRNKLSQYMKPVVHFDKLELVEGLKAHYKLLLPPAMLPGKKYPLILRVYAGPGTSRAKDAFDLDFYDHYLSVNRSFIVASFDVRGSGVMGVDAMHSINNALGTYEVTDTLTAISLLVKAMITVIDPERVGVWGWSYGGFTASMMLAKDEQRLLRCAAAVAPVTSWRYYDSIYTERYMDTPAANPLGYAAADVTAAVAAAADRLRTSRLLLVHGTGDDNVHYQNSMMLAKQLQRLDIPFEQMSYPDESHSLLGVSRHFTHTLDNFWTKCFDNINDTLPNQ